MSDFLYSQYVHQRDDREIHAAPFEHSLGRVKEVLAHICCPQLIFLSKYYLTRHSWPVLATSQSLNTCLAN